jgi:hypothetical protein
MNCKFLVASALLTIGLSASPAMASQSPARPAVALTTFRLQVTGTSDPGATYWIAYGPLAGKFGIAQLHQRSRGVYTASLQLPTNGKSVFSYMVGHGAVHTRLGVEPGGPVLTVRQFGPTSVWPHGIPAVRWHPPAS